MKSFFKSFFAALLAMFVFCILGFFILIGLVASLSTTEKPTIGENGVLVLDLTSTFKEQSIENPFAFLNKAEEIDVPSLYNVQRLLKHAKNDVNIKGVYMLCANNPNGYGASEELRRAISCLWLMSI